MNNFKSMLATAIITLLFTGYFNSASAQISTSSPDSTSTEKIALSVIEMNPMKFRVAYHTPGSNLISVRLYDMNNNLLYSENRRTEDRYIKYFDLSYVADGTYTFEVRDGSNQYKQSFDILTETNRVASAN